MTGPDPWSCIRTKLLPQGSIHHPVLAPTLHSLLLASELFLKSFGRLQCDLEAQESSKQVTSFCASTDKILSNF